MLNDLVLNALTDSEKTTYAKLQENYWQATDDAWEASNDAGWCLENNCSRDDAEKYKAQALDLLQTFEAKLNKRHK